MDVADKDKKEYELAVLVRKEEDLPAIAGLIKEHSGEMVADFRAKRVALAYPIKKEKEAIFAYANFRAIGDETKALEHDLNARQDVLRSLVTKPPKASKQSESSREMPRERVSAPSPRTSAPAAESKKASASQPLSNEALEKKIEEILK